MARVCSFRITPVVRGNRISSPTEQANVRHAYWTGARSPEKVNKPLSLPHLFHCVPDFSAAGLSLLNVLRGLCCETLEGTVEHPLMAP